MAKSDNKADSVVAWLTTHRATVFLVENLPPAIWSAPVPNIPRKTVCMVAAHIHNTRCRWIKSLGTGHGLNTPGLVDLPNVRQSDLVKALERSGEGLVNLIRLGLANGGRVPRGKWQNCPTDLYHFVSYFAAHEGHHRGQLCMIARQLGHRLPKNVTEGIWQWTRLVR